MPLDSYCKLGGQERFLFDAVVQEKYRFDTYELLPENCLVQMMKGVVRNVGKKFGNDTLFYSRYRGKIVSKKGVKLHFRVFREMRWF